MKIGPTSCKNNIKKNSSELSVFVILLFANASDIFSMDKAGYGESR